jgi:oxygen-independent coproporphyrinogen-3 oxidase
LADLEQTLEAALRLAPEHLSCYELTLEAGTPLADSNPDLPGEDLILAMAERIEETLRAAGLPRYEISNYAKPGRMCRHNLIYWRREPYLGFGPAAHSFQNNVRFANPPSPKAWRQSINASTPPWQTEPPIPPEEARFESMMLGLRLIQGVDLTSFQKAHTQSPQTTWPEVLRRQRAQGLLDWDETHLWLTKAGLSIQNSILVDLM